MTSTTETAQCGQMFTVASGKQKACKLEVGHEGRHNSAPRKTYVPVNMDDINTFALVEKPTEIERLAPKSTPGAKPAERSATLIALDKNNEELYEGWVAAGKPDAFTRPVGKIHIAPDKVESIRFLIRASANHLGHGIRFGDDGVKDQRGRVVVSWQVRDKRERKTKANGS
jgi:hypothetical protein